MLVELHHEPDLKLNLKFEIEVLCKNLSIDINVSGFNVVSVSVAMLVVLMLFSSVNVVISVNVVSGVNVVIGVNVVSGFNVVFTKNQLINLPNSANQT